MLAQQVQATGNRAVSVTAGWKGLRADDNDLKPAAELIEQLVVVAFLLIEGLEKTRGTLKDLADGGKSRVRKQRGDDAALRCEADPQSFRQ